MKKYKRKIVKIVTIHYEQTLWGKVNSWLIQFEIYNKIWRWFHWSNYEFWVVKNYTKKLRNCNGDLYYIAPFKGLFIT